MTWILAAIGTVSAAITLFVFCAVALGGESDERAERDFREHLQRRALEHDAEQAAAIRVQATGAPYEEGA